MSLLVTKRSLKECKRILHSNWLTLVKKPENKHSRLGFLKILIDKHHSETVSELDLFLQNYNASIKRQLENWDQNRFLQGDGRNPNSSSLLSSSTGNNLFSCGSSVSSCSLSSRQVESGGLVIKSTVNLFRCHLNFLGAMAGDGYREEVDSYIDDRVKNIESYVREGLSFRAVLCLSHQMPQFKEVISEGVAGRFSSSEEAMCGSLCSAVAGLIPGFVSSVWTIFSPANLCDFEAVRGVAKQQHVAKFE